MASNPDSIGHQPVVPWRGPSGLNASGLHGEALAAYQDFDFTAIPWTKFIKMGREMDGATLVKRGGGSRMVCRIADPRRFGAINAAPVYAKRYLIDTARRVAGNLLGGGKARREFHCGRRAAELGLRVTEPAAWAATRRGALLRGDTTPAGYLLTFETPNQGTVAECAPGAGFVVSLARFLAVMHARGFDHDDCAGENLLVAAGANFETELKKPEELASAFILMDVDHGSFVTGRLSDARRANDLAQMLRSLRKGALRPMDARRAFVEAYVVAAGVTERAAFEGAMNRYFISRIGKKLI